MVSELVILSLRGSHRERHAPRVIDLSTASQAQTPAGPPKALHQVQLLGEVEVGFVKESDFLKGGGAKEEARALNHRGGMMRARTAVALDPDLSGLIGVCGRRRITRGQHDAGG